MPDLFPEDLEKWHIFESKLLQIFNSFNANEIRTPLIESTELLTISDEFPTDLAKSSVDSISGVRISLALKELKICKSFDSNICHFSKSSGKRSGIPLND
jgi:hypothetical protein